MKKTVICIFGLASLSCAQGVPGGTINGQAIPDKIFRSNNPTVCGDLREAIRNAARDQAFNAMGLTVTPEDIAVTKASYKTPDFVAQSKFAVDQEKMMIGALTAVDKGQDAQQVYATMLQPKGVIPEVWASYQKQWKDPKGHALILERSTWTPEVLARGYARINFEPEARRKKLDKFVDQELAAKDPVFPPCHRRLEYTSSQRGPWFTRIRETVFRPTEGDVLERSGSQVEHRAERPEARPEMRTGHEVS
jgi:hypothetical protein